MKFLSFLFWGVIRKNKITNAVWMYFKRGTLLPLFVNWLNPMPTGVEIEVSTVCPLKCKMCEQVSWPASEKKLITFEQFKHIVDQFPGLRWCSVTGIGSVMMNPDAIKMLEYCHNKGILMEYAESYTRLTRHQIEKIVECNDHLLVSLDSSNREFYNSFRVGADFDTTISNMKYMLSLRKNGHPRVVFHFVVTKLNIGEIMQYPAFIASLNPGPNTFIQFSRLAHNYPQVADIYMDIPEDIKPQLEAEGERVGVPVHWNFSSISKKPSPNHCLEWLEPYILVTGEVTADCSQCESDRREYQRATAMGNIYDTPLRQIWKGKKYADLRKALRHNKLGEPCKDCILYAEKQ